MFAMNYSEDKNFGYFEIKIKLQYSWLRKSVQLNSIVSLKRLINFFSVLSLFDMKRNLLFIC